MKKRTAVILKNNKKVLLIYRIKDQDKFYVVPGGGIEEGENAKESAEREMQEEASIKVKIKEKLWRIKDNISDCTYFLADDYEGKIIPSSEIIDKDTEKNHRELRWVDIKNLDSIKIKPPILQKKLIEYLDS
ncbi:MAG: NUDIX domain-containing protein [Nanobdellota archaeon]